MPGGEINHTASSAAMPVLVGAPRSGTTLLRLMLDAHPRLAIPPETGFLPGLAALQERSGTAQEALRLVTTSETWPDLGVGAAALAAAVRGTDPAAVAQAVYELYAARHGKRRWGDKTPAYTHHLGAIGRLLPDARFVHLIRDGRAVVASVRRQWFAPSGDVRELARDWADRVRTARREATRVRAYMEVRYEALVSAPEETLREVCAFIHLPFDGAMLRHHLAATERLAEHRDRRLPDGRVITNAQRRAQQANSVLAPDPRLIDGWRLELTAQERDVVEDEAGELLGQLGYVVTPGPDCGRASPRPAGSSARDPATGRRS